MNTPEIDPVTAAEMEREPDFAEEHTRPTFADEQTGTANTQPDESTPEGEGGDGGMDMNRTGDPGHGR
ncbi:hypothetical protein ALI22I_05625 [Saccharothrix sp. ALI-22-I]|uniref:hypothetical protein n=1 Tax=Saccharothrix sp. ALI-22-I TaxID=1933778 RepID=UPI00097C0294|nr:hypothetical protein [Saccharothrix sp. ALI-22-I]ONI92099.1 hypothetical protein ALI22I_05625 [Saccharothrix sp. ALI-22-I]